MQTKRQKKNLWMQQPRLETNADSVVKNLFLDLSENHCQWTQWITEHNWNVYHAKKNNAYMYSSLQ